MINPEQELMQDIAQFISDPLGFVLYVFPWGEPGTTLEDYPLGPDDWQRDWLNTLGASLEIDPSMALRDATASGHGVGKSALVAWIILWAMSTRPQLAGWVTANTQTQLKSKTWRELAVWHARAINKHWFKWTATRFYHVDYPDTWGLDAIPWTEHNSEAFAGLHAEYVLMLMDEASAIADIIWDVAQGAMTTPGAMWFTFGNPTRNTGAFFDCFHSKAHRWRTRHIDARNARMTNKEEIEKWRQDEGEDSDFFRVRVRGEFPNVASNQLISTQSVHAARNAKLPMTDYIYMPVLLGVDVARFGGDETVISVRQGRKHREMLCRRGLDNMQVGALVAHTWRKYHDEGNNMGVIFVDGIGLGAGVVDYLSSLGYPVIDVNVGKAAERKEQFVNKRMECWFRMREWLLAGADIIDDPELGRQLTTIQYNIARHTEKMELESKDELRARKMPSPDRAESIALTFAETYIPTRHQQVLSFEPEYA